jgi:tetratricopeptide (TPR) repeat protein
METTKCLWVSQCHSNLTIDRDDEERILWVRSFLLVQVRRYERRATKAIYMQPITKLKLQGAFRSAVAAMNAKKYAVAVKQFREILRVAPNHGPSYLHLGTLYTLGGNADAAVMYLGTAAKLMPKEPAVQMKYGVALGSVGSYKKAVAALNKAERLAPKSVDVLGHFAHVYQLMGELKKAEFYLRKALKLKPKDGSLYRLLSIARKFTPDDPYLAKMLAIVPDQLESDAHRWELEFAIAKALEDIKDYQTAFLYLKRGNDLMASTYPYDAQLWRDQVAQLKAAQTGLDFKTPHPDHINDAPIFVTGMPRSGTTLIEQIIAAHSQVTSLGETGFAARAIERLMRDGSGYKAVAEVSGQLRSAVADKYMADVMARYPATVRTVDKSIQTYLYLGAIKAIIPNAKFLIVQRDPRDNLLSIYRNFFKAGTHRYAYNFGALADHYVAFRDMVLFWKEHMPSDIYIADYDALVRDPEIKVRELIAACDLDWEDQCLEFHKLTGAVKTLSLAQVRQPIYKSSQKAWQRYGDAVTPLLEALKKRGVDVTDL